MISEAQQKSIESDLSKFYGEQIFLTGHTVRGGGSINDAYELKTNHGKFFVKLNSSSQYPNMFNREAEGLNALIGPNVIDVPAPLAVGEAEGSAYLILEYIENGKPGNNFWGQFAHSLSNLHRVNNEKFGFDTDNYIGSLTQSNKWHADWTNFFIQERLEPLVKSSRDKGVLNKESTGHFDNLYSKMERYFPEESPSLIHGDLWSGNFTCNSKGNPVIFDPAVYYGHREMDIAMSRLFGGFPAAFYEAYNEHFPLESGWEDRLEIANLYPLMVHVNLFGGSYLYEVHRVLGRLV